MNECSPLEGRRMAEYKLAAIIDAAAGDYPIISIDECPEPRLRWSYSHLEITIEIDQTQEGVQFDELGSTVRVDSITAGLALVAATEAIRQGRHEPYIQYRVPSN